MFPMIDNQSSEVWKRWTYPEQDFSSGNMGYVSNTVNCSLVTNALVAYNAAECTTNEVSEQSYFGLHHFRMPALLLSRILQLGRPQLLESKSEHFSIKNYTAVPQIKI